MLTQSSARKWKEKLVRKWKLPSNGNFQYSKYATNEPGNDLKIEIPKFRERESNLGGIRELQQRLENHSSLIKNFESMKPIYKLESNFKHEQEIWVQDGYWMDIGFVALPKVPNHQGFAPISQIN